MSIDAKIDELIAAIQGATTVIAESNRLYALGLEQAGVKEPAKPAAKPAAKAAPAKPKKPEITYAQIAKAIGDIAKDVSRERAIELLKSFGAKTGKDLKPEQYEEFMTLAAKALEDKELA